jgi:hypothetical protein
LGSVPIAVERALLQQGVAGQTVQTWLLLFYRVLRRAGAPAAPGDAAEVVARATAAKAVDVSRWAVNFETVLSLLWQWRAALAEGDKFVVDGTTELSLPDITECINRATSALAQACHLPVGGKTIDTHRAFLRKLMMRAPTARRVSVFTLNYDTLVEQAADSEGIYVLDGFAGSLRRVFRPEWYDREVGSLEASVSDSRIERLFRLYKLHGSINWRVDSTPDWVNPHGVSIAEEFGEGQMPLVYPTPSKVGETLGMPYAELFRRFAAQVVREQSTLFVCGYGFSDRHVNEILWQALTIPSFAIVIATPRPPKPSNDSFLARLRALDDPRVSIVGGPDLGAFPDFVRNALPDLRTEDIESRVARTYLALQGKA